ncbi:MAG: cysteine peptidase family C39 domain-containing protein, partial [Clostridia bacterium]|nr:cysteine peptidase family C39 domain-containing protein [Clostridia bacterium]
MKIIKQHDSYDCGAACLAMIAKFYGMNLRISQCRKLTKTDRNGVNLYGMVDGARKIGLDAESLYGDIDDLIDSINNKKVELPFVAHITNEQGMLHFIVIYKNKNDNLYIADPGKGKYILS